MLKFVCVGRFGIVVCFALSIARQDTDKQYYMAILSVIPAVCPFIRQVPVLYENGLTYCYIVLTPDGSSIILVLWVSNTFAKFRRGYPFRER